MHDCTDEKYATGVERSIVCFHSQAQKDIITEFISKMQLHSDLKIVTEIAEYTGFVAAKESE